MDSLIGRFLEYLGAKMSTIDCSSLIRNYGFGLFVFLLIAFEIAKSFEQRSVQKGRNATN